MSEEEPVIKIKSRLLGIKKIIEDEMLLDLQSAYNSFEKEVDERLGGILNAKKRTEQKTLTDKGGK